MSKQLASNPGKADRQPTSKVSLRKQCRTCPGPRGHRHPCLRGHMRKAVA